MTIFAYLPLTMSEQDLHPNSGLQTGSREFDYPVPEGLRTLPAGQVDHRSDVEVDHDLMTHKPIVDDKNIFFYWHAAYENMPAYAQRNVRCWYRRFSRQGWSIHVLNRQWGSALNLANYLDVYDPEIFPQAFIEGALGAGEELRHVSDLIAWPLLLKYGGLYADVGLLQIGDLDRLWTNTVGDAQSPYEIISYQNRNVGGCNRNLANYFIGALRNNRLLHRCHRMLLELWRADETVSDSPGITHHHPTSSQCVPRNLDMIAQSHYHTTTTSTSTANSPEPNICSTAIRQLLTDYIVQGQIPTMVMGQVDETDPAWNGPRYVRDHYYGIDMVTGSQLIDQYTQWNGQRAWDLLSLHLPLEDEVETNEQEEAQYIVEQCLQNSFCIRVADDSARDGAMSQTLGALWRRHGSSDNVPGTYAHWLRYAAFNWTQAEDPDPVEY